MHVCCVCGLGCVRACVRASVLGVCMYACVYVDLGVCAYIRVSPEK